MEQILQELANDPAEMRRRPIELGARLDADFIKRNRDNRTDPIIFDLVVVIVLVSERDWKMVEVHPWRMRAVEPCPVSVDLVGTAPYTDIELDLSDDFVDVDVVRDIDEPDD
jgi:hypothetical protein